MGKGLFGGIVNGLSGNLSELDKETIQSKYGHFLIENEEVYQGFTLIRDVMIFTDIRMIIIDKQGATGKKTAIKSIFLMNVVDCEMETAGTGIDDSEITITYLTTIKRDSHNSSVATHKLEFPKKMDITPLYKQLFSLAYKNRLEINGIK